MARLIDADALIFDIENNFWDYETVDGISATLVLKQTVKDIRNYPTVDAVPVVHGRWMYFHKRNIAVCTNCSFERDLDANFGKAVGCPNCGAKVDLEVE